MKLWRTLAPLSLTPLTSFLLLFGSLATAQTWTQDGAPSRFSHTAVFDPASKKMVVFGGQNSATSSNLNDLWLVSTSSLKFITSTQLNPNGSRPSGRYGHVATYDSLSNRMTLFGGGTGAPAPCLNDVWILDKANGQGGTPTWMQVSASGTAPGARFRHTGVYDPNSNSMIVFGGSNCARGYFNDVWVLSNANGKLGTPTWTKIVPFGAAPAARQSASAVYDSANNILIIYGGDAGGANFGDVWILSNANGSGGTPVWTQLSPAGTPPTTRSGQSALYDAANNRMTVFGGFHSFHTLNDTFVLTFANGIGGTPTWTRIASTGTAPGIGFHSAVYDSSKNAMYVFAGSSSNAKLAGDDHAFILSNSNGIGTSAWTRGGPPSRYSQSMIYDSATNSVFVLDGQHALTNTNFDDYWQAASVTSSSNLNWSPVNVGGTHPKARWGQSANYDSVNKRVMLFGGSTGFPTPCMNDYWVMTNASNTGKKPTWGAITPTGAAPGVRTRHASAYDGTTNSLIIFGGYNCAAGYYNDVWVLSNANSMSGTPAWHQLSPTGSTPSVRQGSSAVYNSTANTLTVFGGDAGGNPFDDIWVLSFANGVGGSPRWNELTASNNGPSARSGHTATYDPLHDLMTVYGGFDGTNLLGDTWILSAASGAGTSTWTQVVPQDTAPARRYASAVNDPVKNVMIMFGGVFSIPTLPDDHLFSLTDANGQP